MPTGIRRPINLVLGSQKVQIAYHIKSPTGVDIIAADVPALGLHLSVFPNGFVHISDEQGLDERIDFGAIGANRDFENDVLEWAEDILDSAEQNPSFAEDLLAMPSPNSIERSLIRKSPESIDVDPFSVLRDSAPHFPFFVVDSEAVPQYLSEFGPEARPMFAPKSNRVVFPLDSDGVFSFEFDPRNVWEFVRQIPLCARLIDVFKASLVRLTGADDPLRAELPPHLEQRFQSLDGERLRAEIQAVLGTAVPTLRRYTKRGFEPFRLDE